jgi:diguanylate cyclase (GGDEF)-like protein/PAS domain S-box-containing protein
MSDQSWEGCSVLLIEDQPPEVEFICEILCHAPGGRFDVSHFPRLEAGLQSLREHPVDVLLLDLCLPDSIGYRTFERARREAPSLPIILMTNLDDQALAERAVRAGAQDYLIKRKIDAELLVRSIRYAIERQRADTALRYSEQRYALAVQGANDGVWDWDLDTGRVYYSSRWCEMLGFAPGEIGDSIDVWTSRVHPDEGIEFQRTLQSHLNGESAQFCLEYRMRCRDGSYIWVLSRGVAILGAGRRPVRMAGSLTDISGRKQAEAKLVHDALHDALTGLPNRNLLLDHLDLALQQLRGRNGKAHSLLLLDLDRFKHVNDSLGHEAGDRLLVRIAELLRAQVQPGDTLARLSGDEFAVLLADVYTPHQVTQVAQRLLDSCAGPIEINGQDIYVSASIGIAIGSLQYACAHDLLRDADIALYWAKSAGKACYQVFDREMHRRVVQLHRLETELRRAIERHEFDLYYQPIISLGNEGLVGFEALIRWNHPVRGLVLPQEFIGVAEETGLIVPLGWWTLREACRQLRQWQLRFPSRPALSVSVNISGKLFGEPDMASGIRAILRQTGLPAASLILEITESTVLDHGEEAVEKLNELRRLGLGLHVDDFGTGYSSLTYLRKFAYDSLKIDRSFVQEMTQSNGSEAIVQTIIALGKLLGINIIAEGVENRHQLERLRELECPQVQGYWFSRPMDRDNTADLLSDPPVWLLARAC